MAAISTIDLELKRVSSLEIFHTKTESTYAKKIIYK